MINDDETLSRRVRIIARTLSALGERCVDASQIFHYDEHTCSEITPQRLADQPVLNNRHLDIGDALIELLDGIRRYGHHFCSSKETPWTQYTLTIWPDGRWAINEHYEVATAAFGYQNSNRVDLYERSPA